MVHENLLLQTQNFRRSNLSTQGGNHQIQSVAVSEWYLYDINGLSKYGLHYLEIKPPEEKEPVEVKDNQLNGDQDIDDRV